MAGHKFAVRTKAASWVDHRIHENLRGKLRTALMAVSGNGSQIGSRALSPWPKRIVRGAALSQTGSDSALASTRHVRKCPVKRTPHQRFPDSIPLWARPRLSPEPRVLWASVFWSCCSKTQPMQKLSLLAAVDSPLTIQSLNRSWSTSTSCKPLRPPGMWRMSFAAWARQLKRRVRATPSGRSTSVRGQCRQIWSLARRSRILCGFFDGSESSIARFLLAGERRDGSSRERPRIHVDWHFHTFPYCRPASGISFGRARCPLASQARLAAARRPRQGNTGPTQPPRSLERCSAMLTTLRPEM
jgi:hypothetical protein